MRCNSTSTTSKSSSPKADKGSSGAAAAKQQQAQQASQPGHPLQSVMGQGEYVRYFSPKPGYHVYLIAVNEKRIGCYKRVRDMVRALRPTAVVVDCNSYLVGDHMPHTVSISTVTGTGAAAGAHANAVKRAEADIDEQPQTGDQRVDIEAALYEAILANSVIWCGDAEPGMRSLVEFRLRLARQAVQLLLPVSAQTGAGSHNESPEEHRVELTGWRRSVVSWILPSVHPPARPVSNRYYASAVLDACSRTRAVAPAPAPGLNVTSKGHAQVDSSVLAPSGSDPSAADGTAPSPAGTPPADYYGSIPALTREAVVVGIISRGRYADICRLLEPGSPFMMKRGQAIKLPDFAYRVKYSTQPLEALGKHDGTEAKRAASSERLQVKVEHIGTMQGAADEQ